MTTKNRAASPRSAAGFRSRAEAEFLSEAEMYRLGEELAERSERAKTAPVKRPSPRGTRKGKFTMTTNKRAASNDSAGKPASDVAIYGRFGEDPTEKADRARRERAAKAQPSEREINRNLKLELFRAEIAGKFIASTVDTLARMLGRALHKRDSAQESDVRKLASRLATTSAPAVTITKKSEAATAPARVERKRSSPDVFTEHHGETEHDSETRLQVVANLKKRGITPDTPEYFAEYMIETDRVRGRTPAA